MLCIMCTGADRFEGVDWFPSPNVKSPVLKQAISYMECKVGGLNTAWLWCLRLRLADAGAKGVAGGKDKERQRRLSLESGTMHPSSVDPGLQSH